MQNNNHLNQINFENKDFIVRDFLNEQDVGCSNFFGGDVVNMVSRGVLERHVGCCNHDAMWGD